MIAALALLALASSTASPMQFDLICDGMRTNAGRVEGHFASHFHIDLISGRYCADECKEIKALDVISDVDVLVVGDSVIDRTDGAWLVTRPDQPSGIEERGRCYRAEFSGLRSTPLF